MYEKPEESVEARETEDDWLPEESHVRAQKRPDYQRVQQPCEACQ